MSVLFSYHPPTQEDKMSSEAHRKSLELLTKAIKGHYGHIGPEDLKIQEVPVRPDTIEVTCVVLEVVIHVPHIPQGKTKATRTDTFKSWALGTETGWWLSEAHLSMGHGSTDAGKMTAGFFEIRGDLAIVFLECSKKKRRKTIPFSLNGMNPY